MKLFAASSGLFLAAILFVCGYAMAFLHDDSGYSAPLFAAMAAAVVLPFTYGMKATRRMSRARFRVLFAAMMIVAAALWIPLVNSAALRADHAPALAVFSIIWVIASLPVLRAGIRYRP